MLLVSPRMVVVQQVSACLARTTDHGLARNIRRHYPGRLLYATVALLLRANDITIAADLRVMADALRLLASGSSDCLCPAVRRLLRRHPDLHALRALCRHAKWSTSRSSRTLEVPWREVATAMLRRPLTFEGRYHKLAQDAG
jgi:hypothetical protein